MDEIFDIKRRITNQIDKKSKQKIFSLEKIKQDKKHESLTNNYWNILLLEQY